MNVSLSTKWGQLRGLKIISIALGSVTLPEEDTKMIQQLQRTAVLQNPNMAGATLVGAQADAMKAAASNAAGAMNGFVGMGMAMNVGGANAQNLFTMGQQQTNQINQTVQQPTQSDSWKCSCGAMNKGKFCTNCGAAKPKESDGWVCSCGAVNKGNFCPNCGTKRPTGTPLFQCDKCGWKPEDPANPPKFCPECGDIFDDNDRV